MDVCRGLRRRLGVPFAVFAPTKQRAFTIDHSRAIFDSSTGRGWRAAAPTDSCPRPGLFAASMVPEEVEHAVVLSSSGTVVLGDVMDLWAHSRHFDKSQLFGAALEQTRACARPPAAPFPPTGARTLLDPAHASALRGCSASAEAESAPSVLAVYLRTMPGTRWERAPALPGTPGRRCAAPSHPAAAFLRHLGQY